MDPPWGSTVWEIAFVTQGLSRSGTSGIEGKACPKSGVRNGSLGGVSTLGRLDFVREMEISPHSFVS